MLIFNPELLCLIVNCESGLRKYLAFSFADLLGVVCFELSGLVAELISGDVEAGAVVVVVAVWPPGRTELPSAAFCLRRSTTAVNEPFLIGFCKIAFEAAAAVAAAAAAAAAELVTVVDVGSID